jgi:hypothetical protein
MVSGLKGASDSHTHFFRDFARMIRAGAMARGQDPTTPKAVLDEVYLAEDEEPSNGSGEMIGELEARNREVITHEAAHMAAGGSAIRGGATYTYQTGPDGRRYAIGGEVTVDMTPVQGNPRATIAKMMAIRAAALSPTDPSPQDMKVAAAAAQIEAQAQAQLAQQATESPTTATRKTRRYAQKSSAVGTLINAVA